MSHEDTFSTDDGMTVTIRRVDIGASDRVKLAALAELDSRGMPSGAVLGAEVRGHLLAAISLDTSDVVANPFSPTQELRSLLELRAAQLRGRGAKRRLRMPAPGRRSRPAVGGSPPGQIISLPRWS